MEDNVVEPREDLIVTAVNFLTNPNVQRSTINQKQRFLRNKGLAEHEIQIACERAGIFTGHTMSQSQSVKKQPPMHTVVTMDPNASAVWNSSPSRTLIARIKDILNSVAIFGGVAYLVYKFYKKFIEPWIFGRDDKKAIETKLDQLTVKVETDMKMFGQEVSRLREDLGHMNDMSFRSELKNFKDELASVRGLLLNRNQFASPNLPSIPSWQLKPRHDSENDKIDDGGSGSGSSETEVVTKNSDSSLEIM